MISFRRLCINSDCLKPIRLSSWIAMAEVLLMILTITAEVRGTHVCNTNDMQAFCVIPNHFKTIYEKAQAAGQNPYPQFQEILKLKHFDKKATNTENGSSTQEYFGSYQRVCELKYVQGNFDPKVDGSPGKCGNSMENPYTLKVTEIEVNGQRMHNWLHFQIKSDQEKVKAFTSGKVTGKIRYAFLVVHNEVSYAIGDFHNHLPCDSDCDCKPPKCYQASAKDAVPCMYHHDSVLTPPGQMMVFLGEKSEVEEIHATWRFAQYQYKPSFTTELHFKAYLFESADSLVNTGLGFPVPGPPGSPSAAIEMNGPHGWNPQYDILWPTIKTLGGWDYYRKYAYTTSQIKCHKPIDEKYYIREDYVTVGKNGFPKILDPYDDDVYDQFRQGFPGKKLLSSVYQGARITDFFSLSSQPTGRLYYGYWRDKGPYVYENRKSFSYGDGWFEKKIASAAWGERISLFKTKGKKTPKVWDEFAGLEKIRANEMFDVDKCGCPEMGTTPPPENVPPPPIQVQGRKSHATQMIIAWLCIVPFGMFIARYYKETYSKVFFLQEFWWFTIHILCFIVAAMFMLGGIYAIEINRKDPIRWGDKNIMMHNVSGGVAILIFLVHLTVGHQRFKNVEKRLIQILLHWMFGFIEYILAIASMLFSGFILQGCLPCIAFYIIVGWVVFQIIFYLLMELHMRKVDKLLNLHPPRSYLPPPVMRVFHMNAPYSRFRVCMLILYGTLCCAVYGSVHVLIKYNDEGQSCFKSFPSETYGNGTTTKAPK